MGFGRRGLEGERRAVDGAHTRPPVVGTWPQHRAVYRHAAAHRPQLHPPAQAHALACRQTKRVQCAATAAAAAKAAGQRHTAQLVEVGHLGTE